MHQTCYLIMGSYCNLNCRVLADGHVLWACEAFSRLHGQQLVQNTALLWRVFEKYVNALPPLFIVVDLQLCRLMNRGWRFFMIKLWNHNLLDARSMNTCNIILQGFQEGGSGLK
jgi:hypothetical protein